MSNKEFDYTHKHFDILRKMAYDYCGIHVTDDKYEMYYARLAKRLRAIKETSFPAYIDRIKRDQVEFGEFINAITTNVTSFEREPHHFAHLKSVLSSHPGNAFSLWSAGCSTGQEPYSILINALPVCEQKKIRLSLLATDLDTTVLGKASQGIYPLKEIESYSKDIKRRFFLKGTGKQSGYCRVKPSLVEHIDFKQLNLFYPWDVSQQFDAIFCRNVLIYFETPKKLEIISRFYQNLKPKGYLFLGHSESIPRSETRWQHIGKNIYQSTGE